MRTHPEYHINEDSVSVDSTVGTGFLSTKLTKIPLALTPLWVEGRGFSTI